ncbi:TRAP transporter large permease [Photobacterium sp. DNB23_23_1]|uniref:TRAP transporter large permease protein n=1 Tax=Photobacterium pectinilyticum TaxID=2906793 RepID=A0ABT1N8D1_9GAMM|nr:TRAP transporter large permease [Photobacterium sp. ZSDE20]MCQ1061024.1 TRAP transporter large permease [Photobacterium sp. ZSDE20]MDD1829028.1 TRAP transporter large permease [Photobacterium sp. ZSDE20]
MDLSIGFWLLCLFMAMIIFSVPIAIAIAMSSLIIMFTILPFDVAIMTAGQKIVTGIDSFSLLAIPFFILAGNIMNRGGIAGRLVNFAKLLVGRLPGSLAHVNILSNMMFGAVSGSAVASAAAVGKTLSPELQKEGYDKSFSTAVNVASCPAGLLIPPSNSLIVFSVVSGGTSVAALFIAGYVPGILMGLSCMAVAYFIAKRKGYVQKHEEKKSIKDIFKIVWDATPSLGLIVVVIGGIIGGVFTATEGACIAVLYSFILSLCYRSLNIKLLKTICIETTEITGIMLFLIGASTIMSWAMAFTGLPAMISEWMLSISDNPIIIFILMNVILLIIGMFMDLTPALLIFTPIFMPIATSLGMHPIHFAMMIIFNLCIGIATPPVGTALFVGCSVSGAKIESVIKSILPFCLVLMFTLLLITFIPSISLFLPKALGLIN